MKKIFLLLVFLLSADIMFGQFDFGLKLGYNATKLTTNLDSVTSSFGSGFHVGAFARIGKKFYLQPEAYYSMQTDKFKGDSTNWAQNVKIGSMDIPLLVGFKALDAKVVKLRIVAGPVASFVVNRKVKDLEDVTGPLTEADINNVNWMLQAGAGLDVLFLALDIRYQVGLNSVIQDVQTTTWDTKGSGWVISLGIKLL
jgi:hypothetical protein